MSYNGRDASQYDVILIIYNFQSKNAPSYGLFPVPCLHLSSPYILYTKRAHLWVYDDYCHVDHRRNYDTSRWWYEAKIKMETRLYRLVKWINKLIWLMENRKIHNCVNNHIPYLVQIIIKIENIYQL